jgi:hypothetical protein
MDKVSRANSQPPELNNTGARQFEYAFVKRGPTLTARGFTATGFLKRVCENSYCVGSISCVGCVAQLRTKLRTELSTTLRTASSARELRTPLLRTASSSPELSTVLRPVASHSVASLLRSCASSSCASPISVLSRTHRITWRAATAMKVKRTAERLADLIRVHKQALRQLVELSAAQSGDASSTKLSKASGPQLRPSELSSCELRSCELRQSVSVEHALSGSALRSSEVRPSDLSQASSTPRPCELRPSQSVQRQSPRPSPRPSPLARFALVASKSAVVVSVASPVVSPVLSQVVLGRSLKPTLH